MFFVGQLDDDSICMERPEGADLWWYDKASFYVFTCSKQRGKAPYGVDGAMTAACLQKMYSAIADNASEVGWQDQGVIGAFGL